MSKRILILLLGNSGVASSRIRGYGLQRGLLQHGCSVDIFDASDRLWLLKGLLKALLKRYDAVILQKLTPPVSVCRLLYTRSSRAVYELDDAVYLGYPGETQKSAERRSQRVIRAIAMADVVTTTSPIIEQDIKSNGSKAEVVVFPGPSPLDCPAPAGLQDRDSRADSVMWLGSPSTEHYLDPILDLARRRNIAWNELLLVGTSKDWREGSVVGFRWSASRQEAALAKAGIGLMPLTEATRWDTRKGGYKLIEYLANGLVPVASRSEATATALRSFAPRLAVLVDDARPESWANAIRAARVLGRTKEWNDARVEYLSEITNARFAERLLEALDGAK
jgi:hypothetical protein